MLVSKNTKICITPTPMLKFALPPMPNPNASRWNIGGVGSPTQNSRVGHVDFMLFVSLSLALASQREHNFQWNMGLTYSTFRSYHSYRYRFQKHCCFNITSI